MNARHTSFATWTLRALASLLLAAAAALWWAQRHNTLAGGGRWFVGKDAGKFVFYAHEFMFQPIDPAGLDLTSCMGFQEILYHHPEGPRRRLASLSCRASVDHEGYLWFLLRKDGLRLLGFRLSRHAAYPSGFYRYDEAGEPVEHVPADPGALAAADAAVAVEVRLRDGRWQALVGGRVAAEISDAGPTAGEFGFRGSGWALHPVTVGDIAMAFEDPSPGGRRWVERERFSLRPAFLRALPIAWLFAACVGGLRVWRRRVLGPFLPAGPRAFAWLDDASFVACTACAVAVQATAAPASGLTVPLALLAGEAGTLVAFAVARRTAAGAAPAVVRRATPFGFALALGLIAGAAVAVRGPWLSRGGRAGETQRDDAALAAMVRHPGDAYAADGFRTNGVDVAPGRAFFIPGRAYNAQRIEVDFIPPSNAVFDVAFQQQSLLTRGDLHGEQLPLQRRLLRLSTRGDVDGGLSRRTDSLMLPFAPPAGVLRAGELNHLVLQCDARGTEATLNGDTTRFAWARPIGRGETGFLAYDGRVRIERVTVTPLPDRAAAHRLAPLAAAALPLAAAAALWLLLRGLAPVAFGDALRVELAALCPAACFAAVALVVPADALEGLGRARLAWLDLAVAATALAHLAAPAALRLPRAAGIALANAGLLAAVAAGALCGWDLLPADHPLRLRFAREALDPGATVAARGADAPWYHDEHRIGADTYVWRQRFGGRSLPPAKAAGAVRIFVVGGSQAWGSGAASSRHTFAQLLEERLSSRGLPVEVFNAAANGGGIERALDRYVHLLRGFEPDLLIADVGLNESTGLHRFPTDEEQARHSRALVGRFEALVQACRADGVDVLLALEPMCGETPLRPMVPLYDGLEDVAHRSGVAVLRGGDVTLEREPTRFIWWDTAHFTPYGHRLFAEALLPEAERIVRARVRSRLGPP